MASRRVAAAAAAGMLATAVGLAGPATAKGGEVGGYGSEYHLSDSFATQANLAYVYGHPADQVFVGDWDGNGTDTLAVRRGATFHLRNAHGGGAADVVVTYGRPGDVVLVGDWDGDGTDTLAVRRGAQYHLKNSLTGGPADVTVVYGRADDTVLVGDWDADGDDTLAVRRGAQYYVKNTLAPGPADQVAVYGRATDDVYVGDWDADGDDTLAVRRGAQYFLANAVRPGPADHTVVYGRATDTTLVGDWNGDGRDTLGVRRAESHRSVAQRAVDAAAAGDETALLAVATPAATEWMLYAYQEFYTVEGPYSIGTCEAHATGHVTCLVLAASFGDTAIGSTQLTWSSDRGWIVTEYNIYAD